MASGNWLDLETLGSPLSSKNSRTLVHVTIPS